MNSKQRFTWETGGDHGKLVVIFRQGRRYCLAESVDFAKGYCARMNRLHEEREKDRANQLTLGI